MKKPSSDDMLLAAEWLDVNEGDEGESETCHKVADWLRKLVDDADQKKVENIAVRELVKRSGVTMKRARQAWRNRKIEKL